MRPPFCKDNCRDLGKWLHGDAKSSLASQQSHAAFHLEAGKVAQAVNARKSVEAEAMLHAGTPYASASSAVGVASLQLKKETKL